ncbi:uncharacterized protein BDCG_05288 [Blastomyces dermatitidis ER-3]|uniref:Uncharacterized protein n=1 Tax=Ajellomyces dermatitidis (strain ER-3 / ATCC MYA-2586) TaxID=559297 RepID=A0ABP2F0K5_AJEDR|nr:uncharacterized protein BDCG_05288 [Blastomyces dermatitidis ER-3]EEQ90168.2 hypothetical protein BDCG_05288 [Blastomyces dermatitidis ER-3]
MGVKLRRLRVTRGTSEASACLSQGLAIPDGFKLRSTEYSVIRGGGGETSHPSSSSSRTERRCAVSACSSEPALVSIILTCRVQKVKTPLPCRCDVHAKYAIWIDRPRYRVEEGKQAKKQNKCHWRRSAWLTHVWPVVVRAAICQLKRELSVAA